MSNRKSVKGLQQQVHAVAKSIRARGYARIDRGYPTVLGDIPIMTHVAREAAAHLGRPVSLKVMTGEFLFTGDRDPQKPAAPTSSPDKMGNPG